MVVLNIFNQGITRLDPSLLPKMKLSLLQGTELRYVGFSRLWVRPLVPTSGAGGFDDYVGAELIKGSSFNDYNLRLQAAYGKAEHHQDFIDNRDIKLISSRFEKDESWINFALFHARYDVDTRGGVSIMDDAELLMGSVESDGNLFTLVFEGVF